MTDQIDVNAIADVLNGKVDLADGTNQADVDYVVESQLPTSENNYTWYRLYKSGWVEQGGCFTLTVGTSDVRWDANFPITMSDTNYSASVNANGGNATAISIQLESDSTIKVGGYVKCTTGSASSKKIVWIVMGMSAQGGNE